MEAGALRFYLDENVPVAVADQLRQRGITVVTVRDLALLGDSICAIQDDQPEWR